MSGDPLDLDATLRRVRDAVGLLQSEANALRRDTPIRDRDPLAAQAIDAASAMVEDDTLALVAEVRRLRAQVALCDDCEATRAQCERASEAGAIKCCPDCRHRETWPDGNRRVPGESFDDYNARMVEGINNIPDDQLARHPDGTLDTEPACWCNVPALLALMRCPRHLGYFP